jgi:hypothetical protein
VNTDRTTIPGGHKRGHSKIHNATDPGHTWPGKKDYPPGNPAGCNHSAGAISDFEWRRGGQSSLARRPRVTYKFVPTPVPSLPYHRHAAGVNLLRLRPLCLLQAFLRLVHAFGRSGGSKDPPQLFPSGRMAIPTYSGFGSIRMLSRPICSATRAIVPLPPKGSSTSHGNGRRRMHHWVRRHENLLCINPVTCRVCEKPARFSQTRVYPVRLIRRNVLGDQHK